MLERYCVDCRHCVTTKTYDEDSSPHVSHACKHPRLGNDLVTGTPKTESCWVMRGSSANAICGKDALLFARREPK